jgi:hypothetical protein
MSRDMLKKELVQGDVRSPPIFTRAGTQFNYFKLLKA